MSDTLSSNAFNVGLAPIVPKAPVGSNPSSKPTKMANTDTTRELSGLSEYNPETGEADKTIDFGDKGNKKIEKPKAPKPKAEASTEEKPNRHQEWKARRQEEKQAREAAKAEKIAKQQELVLPALQKGDFTGAAKALNITVPELFTLFQNASLSIPTQPKELTAEEKKAKDESDYRTSLENRVKEFETYKYETVKHNYIKENIDPIFSNKEKYELLNNSKDINHVKSAVYEYMNQHYNETLKETGTGEVLSVEDILDTMEDQLSKQADEGIKQFKNLKKFSKYFNQAEEAEKEAKAKASKKAPAQIQLQEEEEETVEQDEEEEDDLPETDYNVTGIAGEKPFWQMTIQEKVAWAKRNGK